MGFYVYSSGKPPGAERVSMLVFLGAHFGETQPQNGGQAPSQKAIASEAGAQAGSWQGKRVWNHAGKGGEGSWRGDKIHTAEIHCAYDVSAGADLAVVGPVHGQSRSQLWEREHFPTMTLLPGRYTLPDCQYMGERVGPQWLL